MHAFRIRYRNTQGTLMRILNAASRRGIDVAALEARPTGLDHELTLHIEVHSRQIGQLTRDWYSVVDVVDVRAAIAVDPSGDLTHERLAHRPATVLAAGAGSQPASAYDRVSRYEAQGE